MTGPARDVRPVTTETWPDMRRLFEARGSPHYCWCMVYRDTRSHEMDTEEKRAAMEGMVADGTPVGMLAYHENDPIGWISIAPRETFPKLERSRVMPKTDEDDVWTILCMFVTHPWRGNGVTHTLLAGAVEYARAHGAAVIEAYPWDTAGITSTHMGHSSMYETAGFVHEAGRRWVRRLGG